MSAVTVKLRQTKIYTGSQYGVQERTLTPAPAKLGPLFVLTTAAAPDRERLLRVATPNDLVSPLTENPLDRFGDDVDDFITGGTAAAPGDVLVISNPPGAWDPALPPTLSAGILAVAGGRLRLDAPFWSSFASLGWVVKRNGSTIRTGTKGFTARTDEVASVFLVDRAVILFDTAQESLDHIAAVQASVAALEKAVALEPASYLAYPPGNPINNTYSS